MKKIRTIVVLMMLSSNITYALSITQENQLWAIISMFEDRYDTKEEKIQTLNNFITLLSNARDKVHTDKIQMIDFLEQETRKRIQSHQSWTPIQLPHQSTRDKREALHNNVRQTPITQDTRLNQTAQTRAEHLAKNKIKAGSTHKRSPEDKYYDYAKIEKWFSGFWIEFSLENGLTFSESVSYNTVSCKSDDCEKEIEMATEKSRQFLYESEKTKNGPHYRAIMESNFKHMGIGIALTDDRKWYYIVIHYATNITDI